MADVFAVVGPEWGRASLRVAVIGRTRSLLAAAQLLTAKGHDVAVIWTCRAEAFYDVKEADFEKFASDVGASFVNDIRINSKENVYKLAGFGCDIAISMNWLGILGQEILDLFPFGILNAHAGDLPRFRGNACPNWAILAGEPRIGLCIHQMAPELDSGPVVLRDYYLVDDDTYISDVYRWMEDRIPILMADAVEGLASGSIHPVPQPDDPSLSLRTYPRRPEDSRIDWAWPAEAVSRMVRASSHPFEGAFSSLEGERRVVVWRAEKIRSSSPFLAVPGQVCFAIDGDPVIACGKDMIRLQEVSMDGLENSDAAKKVIFRSLRNRMI